MLIVTTVSGFVPQFEMGNVKILQNLGYEVHYASNFREPNYGTNNDRLKGKGIICHQVDFVRSPFQIRENLVAYLRLKKIVQKEHFSIIHCHTPMGGVLARIVAHKYRRKGTKVIYTAHGFHFYQGASVKNWLLYYPIECFFSRFTDILVTINKEDYKRACNFCRHQKTKVKYIPGVGIDLNYWIEDESNRDEIEKKRSSIRKALGVKENEKAFFSIGELTPRKNHEVAIKAFSKLDQQIIEKYPFQYFICGQGILKNKLLKEIHRYHLSEKVHLLGYRENIREILYGMDVFLFPSIQEGMPMALMEAMAVGLPIIASNIRGNKELAINSGVRLEEMYNIECWSQSIQKMLMINQRQREQIRKQNQSRISCFDQKYTEKIMLEIYRELNIK